MRRINSRISPHDLTVRFRQSRSRNQNVLSLSQSYPNPFYFQPVSHRELRCSYHAVDLRSRSSAHGASGIC
jgi:hypothetical protein